MSLRRWLVVAAICGLALPAVLVPLQVMRTVLSAGTLNATGVLALPDWLNELTERSAVAYPTHVALGTMLEALDLSPPATAIQWFKAAAHARSYAELERAAEGISAALERDADDRALWTLCTVKDVGNARQMHAVAWAGTRCDRWTPNVALEARVAPDRATAGSTLSIRASVTSATSVNGLVDLEVHDGDGRRVAQWVFPDQELVAGQQREYGVTWVAPADLPPGAYVVKLGVFRRGWTELHGWKNSAALLTITP